MFKKPSADQLTGILNNNSHNLTFDIKLLKQKKENSQLCKSVSIIISYSIPTFWPLCIYIVKAK